MDQVSLIDHHNNLLLIFSITLYRENSIEECGLELYFSVDFEVLGQIQSHDLCEGGADKRVDDSNKEEYLRLMTDWRFSRGILLIQSL